ncbi:hypothetical protein FPHOBKDP_00222 [Listeria phage LPJP1]|nr:hypothetical protein FPHOBKDP_00222 [Listeria phage LPJP1]
MNSFFQYMRDNRPEILNMLNYGGNATSKTGGGSIYGSNSSFIKPLTNRFINMSLKGISTITKEVNETFYGHKQLLPGPFINSVVADETSVTFEEDKNSTILQIHKLWTDYIEAVSRGQMKPNPQVFMNRYIDYTSSIYYFLLDFVMETILYYTKYTGCSPTNVPYDVMNSDIGASKDIAQLSFNYAYSYKEDMDPAILMDFNSVSLDSPVLASSKDSESIIYSTSPGSAKKYNDFFTDLDLTKLDRPAVVLENYGDNEKKKYKLKFVLDN